jgi:hypothetical protein
MKKICKIAFKGAIKQYSYIFTLGSLLQLPFPPFTRTL